MRIKAKILNIRAGLLIMLTHRIALPLLKRFRKPGSFVHNREDLRQLPQGSLGRDLYEFLEERNLPLLKHYARHDLKHVLLGFDTTEEGEVCLQSFMLGNGRISFPVIATVFFGVFTMPEHWNKMRICFYTGKRSRPFHSWEWNEKVKEQTQALREKIINAK